MDISNNNVKNNNKPNNKLNSFNHEFKKKILKKKLKKLKLKLCLLYININLYIHYNNCEYIRLLKVKEIFNYLSSLKR